MLLASRLRIQNLRFIAMLLCGRAAAFNFVFVCYRSSPVLHPDCNRWRFTVAPQSQSLFRRFKAGSRSAHPDFSIHVKSLAHPAKTAASVVGARNSPAAPIASTDDLVLAALRRQIIFDYDEQRYPFRAAVCAVLGLDGLDGIDDAEPEWHVDGSGNRVNRLQVRWNADRDRRGRHAPGAAYAAFDDTYRRFVREVVAPGMGGGRVLFQRAPTLRVMSPVRPGAPAPGVMSRLHCDMDYHHQPSELNFWLPLTPVFGGNSLWVESAPGRGDFAPLEMRPGQCCRFYGNRCRHRALLNDTGRTRVSLDFRAVSDASGGHDPGFRRGVRRGAKALFQDCFDVGGFYDECAVPPAHVPVP